MTGSRTKVSLGSEIRRPPRGAKFWGSDLDSDVLRDCAGCSDDKRTHCYFAQYWY